MDSLTQYELLCFSVGLVIGLFIFNPLKIGLNKINREQKIIKEGLILVNYEFNKERKIMTDREGNIIIFYNLDNVWEYRERQQDNGKFYVFSIKAYNIVKKWDEEQFKSWVSGRYGNMLNYIIYDIPKEEQLKVQMMKWPFT